MFSAKSVCFYLSLIFVAVPHVLSSTGVNKTAGNGKVFITGDHNEVVVSTARETKIELDEIKSKLQSLSKKTEKLSVQVQAMAQSFKTTLEKEDYGLLFPRKGTSDYVIKGGMPSLTAVTMCFWMKTADKGNEGVPLSYAATSKDHNELAIWDYRKFQIFVGGTHRVTSVSANDGKWHHICLTWENIAGSWNLFKDGYVAASGKGLKTGHVIRGGGALVLGQEQDSLGGSFDANQSFIGEMTGVNVWNHVIKEKEIRRLSKSCLTGVGNVFKWRDFKAHLVGSVKIFKPSC
ncbi:neuronal pentraxin-2-like [Oculina patagonica]